MFADQYIKSGAATRVLLVGSEINSRLVDWSDRGTCIIFGDGAGAIILEANKESGIVSTHIHADGLYQELLYVPSGTGAGNGEDKEPPFFSMKGNAVFKMAVKKLGQSVNETLAANNINNSDIDWLVPHQANIRIITATAKQLGVSMDRVVVND